MFRSLTGGRVVACAAACIALALGGCASEEHPLLLPSPGDARAVIRLGPGRLAVLAGPATARGVFFIDDRDGHVLKSFGVTGTATDLTAGSGDGPLFLTVGSDDGRKSVGALETWSLDGQKTHVEPLPGAALTISAPTAGKMYALVSVGKARSIVPISADGKAGTPIATDADAASLASCSIGGVPYLALGTSPAGRASLLNLRTKVVKRSDVLSSVVACAPAYKSVLALQRSSDGASVSVLSVPKLYHQGLIDVGLDVIGFSDDGDALLAVQSSSKGSTIVRYPRALLERALGLGSKR